MTTTATWITRRPHPDGVEACIRDTNINVWGLVARRRHGLEDARILASIQGLTPADLEAAWAYYDEHPDEIEEAIRRNLVA
jgi:type III restriction enzyme